MFLRIYCIYIKDAILHIAYLCRHSYPSRVSVSALLSSGARLSSLSLRSWYNFLAGIWYSIHVLTCITLFQAAAAHAIRGYLNATAAVEAAVVAAGIASRGPSAAAAAAAAAADAARQAQASLLAEATAALPGCLTDADVCFT